MQHQGLTKWFNPTGHKLKVEFRVGPPIFQGGRMVDTGLKTWVFDPGETHLVPSEYDGVFQQINADGVVISGLAPQLVKNGEPTQLHPALDPAKQAEAEAGRRQAEAEAAKAKAEADGKAAEAERQAAEAQLRAQEKERKANEAKAKLEEKGSGGDATAEGGKSKS